jgi:hypothetical protein
MATTDAQRAATATTTQLAKIILLSERRVQQLVRAGVLKHAYDEDDGHELRGRFHAIPNVQNYIRYLREELGSEDVTETRFLDARSRRMAAMASAEELRLGVLRRQLHRAEDVEYFMSNRDSAIRARLLAISGHSALGRSDRSERDSHDYRRGDSRRFGRAPRLRSTPVQRAERSVSSETLSRTVRYEAQR